MDGPKYKGYLKIWELALLRLWKKLVILLIEWVGGIIMEERAKKIIEACLQEKSNKRN